MCCIFALLNNKHSDIKRVQESFKKGKDRGPENSKFLDLPSIHCSLGFHRLAINGVNDENSNQRMINSIFSNSNLNIIEYSYDEDPGHSAKNYTSKVFSKVDKY